MIALCEKANITLLNMFLLYQKNECIVLPNSSELKYTADTLKTVNIFLKKAV